MIAIAVTLIILFASFPSSGDERADISESLHDVSTTQNHAIMVGDKGAIYHLTGDSIKKITLPYGSHFWLKSVYFTDQSNGWIAGSSGSVLRTIDGGLSWNYIPTFFDNNFHACVFKNSLTGLVAGSDGIILSTKDGGKSWSQTHKKLGTTIYDLSTVDDSLVFAVGQSGYAAMSTNFGATWRELKIDDVAENHNLYGINFLNSQAGLIHGANGTLLFTHDSGKTWRPAPQLPDISVRDLIFKEELIIAAGDSGKIGFSNNFGNNWIVKQIMPSVDFYGISEIEPDNFLVVGSNGTIIRLSLEKDETNSIDIHISKMSQPRNLQTRSGRFRDSFISYFGKSNYQLDPLGEGDSDIIDTDPRFDFDRVDCVTITEQSLGLAIQEDANEFLHLLDKIRYRGGNVSFFNRSHFFVPDWIPANSWLIEDVTTNIGGNLSERLTRTIGRQKFFALKNISIPQVKDAINYETFYISKYHVANILGKIDQPLIVSFIGAEDWLFSLHVGMVFQKNDDLLLRHASMSAKKVVEEPFLPYLLRMKKFIGIKLLRITN